MDRRSFSRPTFFVAFLLFLNNIDLDVVKAENKYDEKMKASARQVKSRRQRLRMFEPATSDVVFILDKSSEVKPVGFAKELKFVKELMAYLPIFSAETRVAVVSVATQVKIEFTFNKYINRECTIEGIDKIRYTGGKNSLARAMNIVHKRLIFNKDFGARTNAKKVVIIFTNGNINSMIIMKIKRLKSDGVIIVPISLTKRAPKLPPTEDNVVYNTKNVETIKYLVGLLGGDIPIQCDPGKIKFDKCQRKCTCDQNGKLVNCYRVRKQFTEMSKAGRARYIQVVKTASTDPTYKERYDNLLTIHKTLFNTAIHRIKYFLPWHRWFILQYENLLREIDCSITVPFWESMEEANDALASDLWDSRHHGFGGNGTEGSQCVIDGPFKEGEWYTIPSAGAGCLKRNFAKHGRFPDCITMREAFLEFGDVSKFPDFHEFLHREYHDVVHCVIGGHMCTDNSASSPEFFLHHAFIDKLWWDWQQQGSQHTMHDHYTTQTSKMPLTDHLSKDFLDLQKQPGCVSIEYRDPSDEIYQTVKAFTKAQVKDIPRLPPPPYPENAKKLFQLSEKEMGSFNRIRRLLKPVKALKENELVGLDRILGFRVKDMENEKAKGMSSKSVFQRSVDDQNDENDQLDKDYSDYGEYNNNVYIENAGVDDVKDNYNKYHKKIVK